MVEQCVAACDAQVAAGGELRCESASVSSNSVLSETGQSVTRFMSASTKYTYEGGEHEPIQSITFAATQSCNTGSTYIHGACLGGPKKGPPKNCGGTNPIDILNGNKYQVETDFQDNISENSLDIRRIYQWVSEVSPQTGNWSFYDVSTISFETFEDYSSTGDGSQCGFVPDRHIVFTLNQSNHESVTFVGTLPACGSIPSEFVMSSILDAQKEIQLRAELNVSGDPTGSYVLNYPTGQIDTFVESGVESKIISKRFIDGKLKQFFYDVDVIFGGDGNSQTLDQIVDERGRKVSFFHNGANQVVEAIDVNGESYKYLYDSVGRLINVSYPDKTPNITGSNPFGEDNSYRTYYYENGQFPSALTGISNENGSRVSTWQYDFAGRAHVSMHANNTDLVAVDYTYASRNSPDPRVTVTNAQGKSTTYHFVFFNGGSLVTQIEGHASANCLAANKNYTYYPNGLLQTKTDWKNNTTSYQYNTRNLESSRTEALGTPQERTITTEWHPIFNLRTKITVPGKETVFTYDAQGRLLSQSSNELPLS